MPLANVRERLRPGGRLVVQGFIPNPAHFQQGERIHVGEVDARQVRLDVTSHDPLTQTLFTQRIVLGSQGLQLFPMRVRYVWPSELDLMCAMNGLKLVARVGEWDRSPLTARSSRHVSVYERDNIPEA